MLKKEIYFVDIENIRCIQGILVDYGDFERKWNINFGKKINIFYGYRNYEVYLGNFGGFGGGFRKNGGF